MTFKAKAQPLCRCCGKPIRKWTGTVYFGRSDAEVTRHLSEMSRSRTERPKTKEEAQRLVNQQIVALSWHMTTPPDFDPETQYVHEHQTVRDFIDKISTWDGETYADGYFCKGTCASSYAYMIAASPRNALESKAYAEALQRQKEKK